MARRYWFARVHPLDDPRKNMVPIAWQGWAVTAVFMFGALFSIASAFMLWESGNGWWAVLTTPVIFILAAYAYVVAVAVKSDVEHTAKDYRERKLDVTPQQ